MPGMITGTAGVSPVRLLHPDPETARDDSRLTELGWSASGRDVVAPPAVFAVELDSPVARVRGVVAVWDVLDPPVSGGLVPHEQTDARAVRRRIKALRSAHLDRDPLLLTHRGGGTVGRVVDGDRGAGLRGDRPAAPRPRPAAAGRRRRRGAGAAGGRGVPGRRRAPPAGGRRRAARRGRRRRRSPRWWSTPTTRPWCSGRSTGCCWTSRAATGWTTRSWPRCWTAAAARGRSWPSTTTPRPGTPRWCWCTATAAGRSRGRTTPART